MKKRLYRRENDRYFTGLAGGIADYLDVDASFVRLLLVFLEFATGGLLILAYFIVSFFVPKESEIKH